MAREQGQAHGVVSLRLGASRLLKVVLFVATLALWVLVPATGIEQPDACGEETRFSLTLTDYGAGVLEFIEAILIFQHVPEPDDRPEDPFVRIDWPSDPTECRLAPDAYDVVVIVLVMDRWEEIDLGVVDLVEDTVFDVLTELLEVVAPWELGSPVC